MRRSLCLLSLVLALPLQAEQRARVAWLQRAGAVAAAQGSDPAGLAAQLRSLHASPDDIAALRRGIDALGLRNGLGEAVAALRALL